MVLHFKEEAGEGSMVPWTWHGGRAFLTEIRELAFSTGKDLLEDGVGRARSSPQAAHGVQPRPLLLCSVRGRSAVCGRQGARRRPDLDGPLPFLLELLVAVARVR